MNELFLVDVKHKLKANQDIFRAKTVRVLVGMIDHLQKRCMSEEFLSSAHDEIFELFERVRNDFDGSEYQQGKKDGLRSALALLGHVGMDQYNRGGSMSREGKTS